VPGMSIDQAMSWRDRVLVAEAKKGVRVHLSHPQATMFIIDRSLFYSKTGFWPSYCQIATDLDKILHTPIVVRTIHSWADLDRDRRVGGSRPNQNDNFL